MVGRKNARRCIIAIKKVSPQVTNNPYRFSAYCSAEQSFNNNTVDIVFGTELYDLNNNYNHTNGVYTAPVTGYYLFICGMQGNIGAGVYFGIDSNINGSNHRIMSREYYPNAQAVRIQASIMVKLNAGDTIKFQAFCSGAVAVIAQKTTTWLDGCLLSQ